MASSKKLRCGDDYKTDVFDTKTYLKFIFGDESLKTMEFTKDIANDLHTVFQTGNFNLQLDNSSLIQNHFAWDLASWVWEITYMVIECLQCNLKKIWTNCAFLLNSRCLHSYYSYYWASKADPAVRHRAVIDTPCYFLPKSRLQTGSLSCQK